MTYLKFYKHSTVELPGGVSGTEPILIEGSFIDYTERAHFNHFYSTVQPEVLKSINQGL